MARTFGGRAACLLAAGIASALMLSACSSGGSNAASTSPAGSIDPDQVTGKLTVWDLNFESQPDYTKAAKELDARFLAKYPNVELNHVAQPFANYDQILQTAFTSRAGADVMQMVSGKQGVLRWTDGLVGLDGMVADYRPDLRFWESGTSDLKADGPAYGVPVGTIGHVIYYNKDLWEKAGLDPEKPPTTFDELVADAQKLKDAGITPFASGDKEGYENQWWLSFLYSGVGTVDDTLKFGDGQMSYDDPTLVEALTRYKVLQDKGFFAADRFTTPLFPDGAGSFASGEGAMFLGLTGAAADYRQFGEALGYDNLGTFWPVGISGEKASYLPATSAYLWTIPAFASNEPAARAYVDFLAEQDSMQTLFDDGSVTPNDTRVVFAADTPTVLTSMVDALASTPTTSPIHNLIPGNVLTEYSTQMNEVLQGRKSLEEMLASLQKLADRAS